MTLEYTNGIVMNVERMLDSINDQRQKPSLLLVVMKQHQRSLHHGCRMELNSRRSHLPCNLVLLLALFFLVSILDNVLFVEGFRSHFPATSNINPTPSSSTTTTSSSNGDTTGGNNKSWDPHQPPTTTTSASSSNTKSDQEDGGSITSSSTERSETASAVEDNGESTMSFSKLSSESSSAHYKHHPISSTVRRWNEVISTTAADAIPSVTIEGAEERSTDRGSIASSSTTEDDDTERLLIVQESDDARYFFDKTKNGITSSSSSPGTMLQTTEDDQIMIFGREEEIISGSLSKTTTTTTKASSSFPPTISIPTFGSPNAFQFNYKRYHSGMTPPTQLFHTVVLGEDTTSLLKKSKKHSTSLSSSRLYSSARDNIDDGSSADISLSPSENKTNQDETYNNLTGSSSNTMYTSNHENQSSFLRKSSSNNNIANGSSSSSLSSMEGTTAFRVSTSTPTNKPLWHYWRPLLRMCRLRNLPGVALFHLIAIHLIHRVAVTGGVVGGDVPSFIELVFNPGSIATLMVTMLIACISMLFNDYYDAKSGVDLVNMEKSTTSGAASALAREAMNDPMHPYHAKPLVTGEVPLRVARQFITLMAVAVLSLTMVLPGIAPKFAALFSGVIVYYYTDCLKPKTWIKNISCASLIGASPLVSALAAWHTMVFSSYRYKDLAAGVNVMITGTTLAFQIMSRLMICIFSWSMSREIIMDIADHKGDKMVGIQTVPVRYGKRFASKAALVFASCLSISALSGPLMELVLGTTTSSTNGGSSIYVLSPVVRFILALLSSGWMMYHTNRVVQDEGVHDKISQDVVETTMIPAVLALASFI